MWTGISFVIHEYCFLHVQKTRKVTTICNKSAGDWRRFRSAEKMRKIGTECQFLHVTFRNFSSNWLTKWRIPVRLTFMSVRSYFGSLFRVYVPVSLIYHNYFLSTNEAKRKKRYGIFRNFWFLKFLVIAFRIFIQSRSHCMHCCSVYYNGLQKVGSTLTDIAKCSRKLPRSEAKTADKKRNY